jgi:hypothetical protein
LLMATSERKADAVEVREQQSPDHLRSHEANNRRL